MALTTVKAKYGEKIEALDFYYLIGIHLKTITDKLGEGLQPGGTVNAEKLISFYMLTKHYENMVTMFLPDYYWNKKKEIFPAIPPVNTTWADITTNLKFFDSVSQWFQLIHTTAYNEGILKIQRPYKSDQEFEVYKNGFRPTGYD